MTGKCPFSPPPDGTPVDCPEGRAIWWPTSGIYAAAIYALPDNWAEALPEIDLVRGEIARDKKDAERLRAWELLGWIEDGKWYARH